MSSAPATSARPVVFFDVNIGETPVGRIKMELYSDIVPKNASFSPPHSVVHVLMVLFLQTGQRRTSDSYVRGSIGAFIPPDWIATKECSGSFDRV